MLTFQQIILKLQAYWDAQGCALLQPYDMEVGAGTSHTATFLRAIGPEPWKAAYVQPSRRPKDGRYGENPNRLQHYYQYQVVLKPSPLNIQELYLDSLRALELQRPMLRATNTGATVAIDHLGRVTHELPRLTRGVLEAEVEGRTGLTPYARWAGRFGLWPLAGLCLAIVLLAWRRSGLSRP